MTVVRSFWLMVPGLVLLAGCAAYEGDPEFGNVVRSNIALQAVQPVNQPRPGQPLALDGAATKAATDNYVYSYMHPQSQASAISSSIGTTTAPPQAAPTAVQSGSY
jgi:hypothetical protein